MTESALVEELLGDRTYYIEFNGHLTNHAKHAVVALAGLGASEQRIRDYYDNYAKLTPYGYPLEPPKPSKHEITDANWLDHLGARTSFSAYCEFFDRAEKNLGTPELLRRYLTPLLDGWVGSFTHATIHLGWGLDAGSRWMTIEGLAYLAFSFISCHPERAVPDGVDDRTAMDSLLRLSGSWQDPAAGLPQWVAGLLAEDAAGPALHPELARSGLQYRIARLLTEGHPLIYQVPSWLEVQDVASCWEQLYYVVSLVYLAVPGDFVLLHLITSLHAMEQIATQLPAEQTRAILKAFWIGMLCTIFAETGFPEQATLADLHARYVNAFDAELTAGSEASWEETIARALREDEEHNPKMVYVLRRAWRDLDRRSLYRVAASRFTTTPDLPESFEEPPTD